ncbi:acyltransferase family protein [Neotamlana laminarinivorans]|uniref:Acyltransferase n=1 Tax=Neotamlana laminarinivorans TaxID=2883124 RepID=A0A9X1L1A5_9FLAO|nr:acyltransferase [Tamlana laminarinivorans]
MKDQRNRIKIFDIAKGVSIIFMTISHYPFFSNKEIYPSLNSFNSSVMLFKMPLFIFVSGYLFSEQKSLKNFFYSKTDSLIKPLFGFASVLLIMHTIHYWSSASIVSIYDLFKYFNERFITFGYLGVVNYSLWFIIPLFLSLLVLRGVITIITKKNRFKHISLFCILITLFLLNYLKIKFISHVPIFITYLFIGYALKKISESNFNSDKFFYRKEFLLLFVIFIIIVTYTNYFNILHFKINLLNFKYNYHYMLVVSLIGVLGIIHICTYIEKIKFISSLLMYCSKASFFILAFHMFFIDLFRFYFNLEVYNPWFHALLFFSNIVICCLIYELIKKVPVLRLFFYPLKTINFTSLEITFLRLNIVNRLIARNLIYLV